MAKLFYTAALVLIMLAIGAIHLSEKEFSDSAYEASCLLLAQVWPPSAR